MVFVTTVFYRSGMLLNGSTSGSTSISEDRFLPNENRICQQWMVYTGGTVRAKKLSLKSLALSGLFGAKWFGPNCTTGVVI